MARIHVTELHTKLAIWSYAHEEGQSATVPHHTWLHRHAPPTHLQTAGTELLQISNKKWIVITSFYQWSGYAKATPAINDT